LPPHALQVPQVPDAPHVWLPAKPLPAVQHCTAFGLHWTQEPLKQTGIEPVHAIDFGVPVASHQVMVLPLQTLPDGLHVPVHAPGVPEQAYVHVITFQLWLASQVCS
jgi:hypothetical protein